MFTNQKLLFIYSIQTSNIIFKRETRTLIKQYRSNRKISFLCRSRNIRFRVYFALSFIDIYLVPLDTYQLLLTCIKHTPPTNYNYCIVLHIVYRHFRIYWLCDCFRSRKVINYFQKGIQYKYKYYTLTQFSWIYIYKHT